MYEVSKNCRWLDSNSGTLVLEATVLPLTLALGLWCLRLVISVIAFYSDDPSLNLTVVYSFFFTQKCCLKRTKIHLTKRGWDFPFLKNSIYFYIFTQVIYLKEYEGKITQRYCESSSGKKFSF